MPEYSSTTITPADGVQVPSMNGSAAGNFLLSALRDYILASKGQANGLASLDGNGKLTSAQLPDLADDVIVVDSYSTLPAIGTASKIYITADNNKMYRWDPELTTPDYVDLSVDLTEYARIVDIQDGNIQAGVAVKAFQDAMGRAIITTYETKADASDLKDAIQGNTARIENLEQEHGGYVTVNYRGTNDVPTGKAKYGLVESIVGKSRAWNNEAHEFSGTYYNIRSGSAVSDGVLTLSNNVIVGEKSNIGIVGHKYLLAISYKSDLSGSATLTNYLKEIPRDTTLSATSTWMQISYVFDCIREDTINFTVTNYSSGSLQFKDFILRDLTLIFPEGVPSTVAECVAKCPSILKYDAYGYSLVDTVVEGVESKARNLLDPAKLNGAGTWNNGVLTSTAGALFDLTKVEGWSGIEFLPSTRYYLKVTATAGEVTSFRLQVNYTDGTNQASSGVSGGGTLDLTLLSAEGKTVKNVLFNYSSGVGGTVRLTELVINVSDSQNGTYTSYWSPVTLSLPSSVTLRSAGDGTNEVYDTFELESGEITRNVLTETISVDSIYTRPGNTSVKFAVFTSSKAFLGGSIVHKLTWKNGGISAYSFDSCNIPNEMIVYSSATHQLAVSVPYSYSKSDAEDLLNGTPFNYAPSEVTTESVNPVIDNTIQTEGGGTIETIQTQTPVIDNSMDVGYLAL